MQSMSERLGSKSVMTDNDREDLRRLYTGAWSGQIKDVNGTPIQLVQPFSAAVTPFAGAVLAPSGSAPMLG